MERYLHKNTKNKLATYILEEQYGKITANILRHDKIDLNNQNSQRIREAKIIDKDNILRAYAITFLTYDIHNNELNKIDDEIRLGGLIGETFNKHGYIIHKNIIDSKIINIPNWLEKEFGNNGDKSEIKLVEFYVKKQKSPYDIYGIILEIYSPNYIYTNNEENTNISIMALKNIGLSENQIQYYINSNNKNELNKKYHNAINNNEKIISKLREDINNQLIKN